MATLEVRLSDEQLTDLVSRIVAELRQPAPADRWLSTAEAAAYLACHPVTVRKLAAEHKLPAEQERPGAKLNFRQSELDRFRRGERR